jgi:hypothetical protein
MNGEWIRKPNIPHSCSLVEPGSKVMRMMTTMMVMAHEYESGILCRGSMGGGKERILRGEENQSMPHLSIYFLSLSLCLVEDSISKSTKHCLKK